MKTMTSGLRTLVRDETGKVLILALMFLLLGALLLTPLLGLMSTGLTAGSVYENRAHSLYAADAGVEDAVNWLLEGRPHEWPWTGDGGGPWERDPGLEVNHHEVKVTIEVLEPKEDNTYKITSESINGGSGTKVIAIVMVQPRLKCKILTGNQTFSNQNEPPPEVDIIVIGTVTIQHNQTVDGSMTVDGDLIMGNQGVINGDSLCVSGTVEMNQGGTKINADLVVGKDLILNQPSEVNGNVFIYGDIYLLSNAEINGDVYAYDGITIEFGSNANINGNIHASGNVMIKLGSGTPNAKINGRIYSTGTVTVDPTNRRATISNGIEENLGLISFPDEPACPTVQPQSTVVDTYHVMGYGG